MPQMLVGYRPLFKDEIRLSARSPGVKPTGASAVRAASRPSTRPIQGSDTYNPTAFGLGWRQRHERMDATPHQHDVGTLRLER